MYNQCKKTGASHVILLEIELPYFVRSLQQQQVFILFCKKKNEL